MPWRIAIVVALMLSFLGVATPKMAEAQSGTATLTIHSRFCPPGYDGTDIFETCHDNIGMRSVEFSVTGLDVRFGFNDIPDEAGNITLSDLPPTEYVMSTSLDQSLAISRVYCSLGDGSSGEWLEQDPTEYGWGNYRIQLGRGEERVCDWYQIPSDDYINTRASLTIHDRFCPVDFTDFGSEWQACLPTLGASSFLYYLSGPTETHESLTRGNATFTWIEPGSYVVSNDMWYQQLSGSVYCSTFDSLGMPFLTQPVEVRDTISLILDPGDEVICDWYHYPTADIYQGGIESPIAVFACETPTVLGGFSGNTHEECHAVYGVDLTIYPTNEPQFTQTCVYDGPGSCVLALPNMIPLTVEIDSADIPAGYAPQCNPCTWWQYGEWTGFSVQFNPTDASSKGD